MSPLGGRDLSSLYDDPRTLTDAILKILAVEERIEEKLDAVLDRRHLIGRRSGTPDGKSFRPDMSERRRNDMIEYAAITPEEGEDASTLMHSTTTKTEVQMRSSFQFLIEEKACIIGTTQKTLHALGVNPSEIWEYADSKKRRFSDYFPINPNAPFIIYWYVITIIIVLGELTYVPYILAWDIEINVLPLGTICFWSVDILISFLAGTYNADGEKDPIHVSARRYALSWFPLDASILLLDWISVLASGSLGYRLLRFSKLARVWRIFSIMRVSKLSRCVDRMMEAAPFSNAWRMIFRVSYLSVTILWVLHLVACFWYIVGKMGPTDNGLRWLDVPIPRSDGTMIDVMTQPQGFQYMLCFHWSVATFTLGNIEVLSANSFERMFVVVFIVSSFLFGSVLISITSAVLVDHHTQCMESTMKLQVLHRFLSENRVRRVLALRVQRVCVEREQMRDDLSFSDTIALKHLPVSLYKNLRYEILGRFLSEHDLFNCWSTFDMRMIQDYCVDGVEMIFLKPGDELFQAHSVAEQAYFFSKGELTYSKDESDQAALVPAKIWLSEAALWSNWRHVGSCEARARCRIAAVCHKSLAHHLTTNRVIRDITLAYCELFCQAIVQAKPPISELPDDIRVPMATFSEMLVHFPNELRTMICAQAIDVSKLGDATAARLKMEIDAGTCNAYINREGVLERVVMVVDLMLQNNEGKVMHRLGEVVPTPVAVEHGEEERHWEAVQGFALPSVELGRGESLEEALRRMVDQKMNSLKDMFEHVSTVLEEEASFSNEFGVNTRYVRVKMLCQMRVSFPATVVAELDSMTFARKKSSFSRSATRAFVHLRSRQTNLSTPKIKVSDNSKKSLNLISLHVIFEGIKPFIYAWLPETIVSMLAHSTQHRIDEWVQEALRYIDIDIIEEALRKKIQFNQIAM